MATHIDHRLHEELEREGIAPVPPDIITCVKDRKLLGAGFRDLRPWKPWFVFLRAFFALRMGRKSRTFYRKCTYRTDVPRKPFREAYLIIGRRGGKSRILALIATYLAAFFDWRPFLAPGELGVVMIVAADKKQARAILNYVHGFLLSSNYLKQKIVGTTRTSITLNNSVIIEIHTASFVAIRSYTVIAALFDEAAFWRSEESANPDVEILNAIRPAMETIPDSVLLVGSSPFFKRGIVYDAYERSFGKEDSEILVWNAESRDMNPLLSKERILRAYERDPLKAKSEWGGQFRTDEEMPFTPTMVRAVTEQGIQLRPFAHGNRYIAFTDPSGGSQDRWATAIAHPDETTGRLILDAVKWWTPPFSPRVVAGESCDFIKSYGLAWVTGDQYAGQWPADEHGLHGISYVLSEYSKSECYQQFVPLVASRRAVLLDLPVIEAELTAVERRPSRTGKEIYDHPPTLHDDVANVVAGVLVLAQTLIPNFEIASAIIGAPLATAGGIDSDLGDYPRGIAHGETF